MAQRSEGAVGAELPDTFAEFADRGVGESYLESIETIRDAARAIEPIGSPGRCPFYDESRVLRLDGSSDIVLGYSITHRIPDDEPPTYPGAVRNDYDENLLLEVLKAGYESDLDVTFYLPADTGSLLQDNIQGSTEEINNLVIGLNRLTKPLAVEPYMVDTGNHYALDEGLSVGSLALVTAAASEIDGRPILASHNSELRDVGEAYGVIAAAPWQIYEWLRLGEGGHETGYVNRIHNVVERFTGPTEYREERGGVPEELRSVEKNLSLVDTVVPDESMLVDAVGQRSRGAGEGGILPTWEHSLQLLDRVVADEDITVFLPEWMSDRIQDTVGGHVGRAIRYQLDEATEPLPMPGDPRQFLIDIAGRTGRDEDAFVERYGHMAEDLAIAYQARKAAGERPLVATYDADFSEIPWVVAAEPHTILNHMDSASGKDL